MTPKRCDIYIQMTDYSCDHRQVNGKCQPKLTLAQAIAKAESMGDAIKSTPSPAP